MLTKVGKYEIIEKIGVGGFGTVYRGRDPYIKRTVAIKTCQSDEDELRKRFFREAEFAGNLHHRNITTIYDFGLTDEGLPYIVQEFLTGEDLDRKIKRKDDLPLAWRVRVLADIATGSTTPTRPESSIATSSRRTSGFSRTARSRSWTSASPSRWSPNRP